MPPYLRVVERIGLAKRLEQPCPCPRAMPMPVSRTAKCSSTSLRRWRRGHREHHLALLGELDRIAEQVEQDLPQPRHVAADAGRHVALEHGTPVSRCFSVGARG